VPLLCNDSQRQKLNLDGADERLSLSNEATFFSFLQTEISAKLIADLM